MTIRNVLDGAELDTCICTKKTEKTEMLLGNLENNLIFFFKKLFFRKKAMENLKQNISISVLVYRNKIQTAVIL